MNVFQTSCKFFPFKASTRWLTESWFGSIPTDFKIAETSLAPVERIVLDIKEK